MRHLKRIERHSLMHILLIQIKSRNWKHRRRGLNSI